MLRTRRKVTNFVCNVLNRLVNGQVILVNFHTSHTFSLVNLMNCHNIKDVSALGNVQTLNLSICYQIKDVSALGNDHITR